MRDIIQKIVIEFYKPKRSFMRSQVDDLDVSREGGGHLNNIINKDAPMSGSKNKSVDLGKSSEKTDNKGSKIFDLADGNDIVDLRNEHLNDVRQDILMGRERLYRKKVHEKSPDD